MDNLVFVLAGLLGLVGFAYVMLQIMEVEERITRVEYIYADYRKEKELRLEAEANLRFYLNPLNGTAGRVTRPSRERWTIHGPEITWVDEEA